ncbi:hypothetical protein [Cereibacter changlensis]|uniref:hypothetical protein n=1 Tax=Cereibacter changlensis TaxID=402884 RepID=UPI004033CDD0
MSDAIPDLHPLLRFSLYTGIQVDAIKRLGAELDQLSDSVSDSSEYYWKFWFWVLGAYETVRLMAEHRKACLSAEAQERTQAMKKKLSLIRVPFAKQELESSRRPVYAELSIADFNHGLVFCINGKSINSTQLIRETIEFFDSFRDDEIVARLPVGLATK